MLRRAARRALSPRLGCEAASRGFLPGLGALLATPEQRRRSQKWQRVVPHPQETIYGVVAQVDAYEQFLPWCMSSRVLRGSTDAAGAGELGTEIRVGFELLQSTFTSNVSLSPSERVHAVSEPNEYMEHLTFTWEFAAVGADACRLDLELDFCLRNPEHVLLWDFAHEKVIAEYVACFSRRCGQLEASGAARGDAKR